MDQCKTAKLQWVAKLKSKRVRRKKIIHGEEAIYNEEYFSDEKKQFEVEVFKTVLNNACNDLES